MMNQYTLGENHEHIPCDDIREWGIFMAKADRTVGSDIIKKEGEKSGVHVSTVFLGTDHNWKPEGKPILYETMIFGGEYDQFQKRYETWEEAEIGHQQTIELVTEGLAVEEELEGYPETVKEVKKATEEEDYQDV